MPSETAAHVSAFLDVLVLALTFPLLPSDYPNNTIISSRGEYCSIRSTGLCNVFVKWIRWFCDFGHCLRFSECKRDPKHSAHKNSSIVAPLPAKVAAPRCWKAYASWVFPTPCPIFFPDGRTVPQKRWSAHHVIKYQNDNEETHDNLKRPEDKIINTTKNLRRK